MVPVLIIAEGFNSEVKWSGPSNEIVITKGDSVGYKVTWDEVKSKITISN